MADSCKKSPSNSIKGGGRGKIKRGAGAALSRIQFTNETRLGVWDLIVASSAQDAYNKGVRPGQAWQLGVDISLFCEGQSEVYCDLQPIPGNVSVMADIEGDIYAGLALSQTLAVEEKALGEKIKAIMAQIEACEKAGCSKEEVDALNKEKVELDEELAVLKKRKEDLMMLIDLKQNCWDGVLSLYTSEAAGFPGEPKHSSAVKLFIPDEEVQSRAAETVKAAQLIAKKKAMSEGKGELPIFGEPGEPGEAFAEEEVVKRPS